MSSKEHLSHDLIILQTRDFLLKKYKDVHINTGNQRNFEIKGFYPDIAAGGYGQITQIIEVETEDTLSPESAERWKKASETGIQTVVLVPKHSQKKLTDILWKSGLTRVKTAMYEMSFTGI